MNTPWQAWTALTWAIIAAPLLLYGASRVRAGSVPAHAAFMGLGAAIEVAVFISFGFVEDPSPRREALMATMVFKVHVALALGTLAGIGFQLGSRVMPPLRRLHPRAGPAVLAVWTLALWTGIYNFVFLYVQA